MNPALETLALHLSREKPPRKAIFLGAEPHPALREIPGIAGWQPFKPKADAWDLAGFKRTGTPTGKWPLVLILPGKSRDETLAWFAMGRDLLEENATLMAAMPNTAGASRFEKELSTATGGIQSTQKNKCRAFSANHGPDWNAEIFSRWRESGERRVIPGTGYLVEPGVFSTGGIDTGSAFLADHLPAHLRGPAADLGAGWGFLTDQLLRKCPGIGSVDLFEADARALDCAEANLRHHERPLRFHWHDITTGLPGTYDTIVMNPPFHTGQTTDIDLGRAFLKTAASSLNRGGRLLLVANRQLPYEAVLEASGLAWKKTAEDKTFKLLAAERRSA